MQNEKAAIFIDASNIHYPLRKNGWRISYRRLLNYFKQRYDVTTAYYYEGTPSKSYLRHRFHITENKEINERVKAKQVFFKNLKSLGLIVRTKPVQIVYDATDGSYKAKCNFDVEIAIDAIDRLNEYRVFILLSGDGDFIKLLKYIKGKYKKTVVISAKNHSSEMLREVANECGFIEDIRSEIEKRP